MPVTDLIKNDPLVATNFFLEIKGEVIDTLSEISGLDVELETTDVTQRSEKGVYVQHKVFSKPKWTGELTVKRIAPNDASKDNLWTWFNSIRNGGMSVNGRGGERKDGSIVIYDSTMTEIARWNFFSAWPSKISQDSLTVGSNDAVSETVTLQYEKLERKK